GTGRRPAPCRPRCRRRQGGSAAPGRLGTPLVRRGELPRRRERLLHAGEPERQERYPQPEVGPWPGGRPQVDRVLGDCGRELPPGGHGPARARLPICETASARDRLRLGFRIRLEGAVSGPPPPGLAGPRGLAPR